MPDTGWVTRDPTPADSPARAQTADLPAGDDNSRPSRSAAASARSGGPPKG